ncbi:molecular chaperone TorD family protein [Bacillaceae bacterium IKA-2]|nr:molecular chaperone TorD family protein [Bacillaceae bacterium IKA-2]
MKGQQSQKSKVNVYELKSQVYRSLAAYYRNQLWEAQDLAVVVELLEEYNNRHELKMDEAIEVLKNTDIHVEEECKFDFNKLFIGPYELLASPYESTYRNYDRLLMRAETLSVRSFYEKVGIQVDGKGQIPDDHIGFELEFIAFLAHQINQEHEVERMSALLDEFLKDHLGKWLEQHVELVTSQAKTKYCKAWAIILSYTVQHDLKAIKIS